jgi:hypothetical protein
VEAVEWEIKQDLLRERPDRQFTAQDEADIREEAELTVQTFPDKAVSFALAELTSYQRLGDAEQRASYELYRSLWISTHGQLIENLYEEADDEVATDLLQWMNTAPGPQPPSTEAPALAAPEDSPVERPQAQEEEEKADYGVKEQHDEKGYEPHGQE